MRTWILCLCLVVVTASSGCQPLDLTPKKWPWSKSDKDRKSEYEDPHRMVAIWTDTVRFSSGGQPTRGFGGRLYFYNDHGQAIPVEGQLAVFAYDDTNVDANISQESRPPDRRFAYTKEQFTKHFSKTDLGASYSVWVPWDAAGGEQRHISLVPVFTTVDGKVVFGQQTANVLPGKTVEVVAPPEGVPQGGVYEGQSVGFEKPADERLGIMKTTTISMPRTSATRPMARPNPLTPAIEVPAPPGSHLPPQIMPAGAEWRPQSARPTSWQDQAAAANYSQAELRSQPEPAPAPQYPAPQGVPAGPPTRFERPRSRALGAPIGRLGRDHALTRLAPATQPSSLPSIPAAAP